MRAWVGGGRWQTVEEPSGCENPFTLRHSTAQHTLPQFTMGKQVIISITTSLVLFPQLWSLLATNMTKPKLTRKRRKMNFARRWSWLSRSVSCWVNCSFEQISSFSCGEVGMHFEYRQRMQAPISVRELGWRRGNLRS